MNLVLEQESTNLFLSINEIYCLVFYLKNYPRTKEILNNDIMSELNYQIGELGKSLEDGAQVF